jgi:hypothetical protein
MGRVPATGVGESKCLMRVVSGSRMAARGETFNMTRTVVAVGGFWSEAGKTTLVLIAARAKGGKLKPSARRPLRKSSALYLSDASGATLIA